ncbi:hypothetical protein ACFOGG_13695 [Brenneria rubrifaciens]
MPFFIGVMPCPQTQQPLPITERAAEMEHPRKSPYFVSDGRTG